MNMADMVSGHHVTITLRGKNVASASCKCGQSFGRGKTAAAGANNHILGWNATYVTAYV